MKTRAWAVAGFAVVLLAAVTARADGPSKKAVAGKTVYVPMIRTDRASRNEALRLTELLIKAIERETVLRVVGSPEEADLVLEATLKPTARPAR